MLTILTLSVIAVILVLGQHVFAAKPKLQPIKIKTEKEQRIDHRRRY